MGGEKSTRPGPPAGPAAPNKLVYLIDDRDDVYRDVLVGLSGPVIDVIRCAKNEPVLQYAEKTRPTAVLVRLDRSGFARQLAEKIKRRPEFAGLRVVLLVDQEQMSALTPAETELMDAVLPVPFETIDVLRAVKPAQKPRREKHGKPAQAQVTPAANVSAPPPPPPIPAPPPIEEPPPLSPPPLDFSKPATSAPIPVAPALPDLVPPSPPAPVMPDLAPPVPPEPVMPDPAPPAPPEPVMPDLTPPAPPEPSAPATPEPEPVFDPNTRLLLLVDNDQAMQDQVRAALPADQWSVRICVNGRLALEMALKQKPAAVVCRREAAGQTGLDVIRSIKEQRALAGVRCIIVIGGNELLDEFQAQMAGVDVVLKHPFTASALQQALEK